MLKIIVNIYSNKIKKITKKAAIPERGSCFFFDDSCFFTTFRTGKVFGGVKAFKNFEICEAFSNVEE